MHKIISFAIYLIAIYAYIMPATAQNGTQVSIEQARKLIRQEKTEIESNYKEQEACLLYTSPSPRDRTRSRMPSSA